MRFLLIFLPIFLYAQNDVCFEIESNPYPNSSSLGCFTKYVRVLDCFDVYAESSVSDEKVLHVAAVIAELLDNDEDGEVDDQSLKNKLNQENALMPVFTYDGNACMNQFFNNYLRIIFLKTESFFLLFDGRIFSSLQLLNLSWLIFLF